MTAIGERIGVCTGFMPADGMGFDQALELVRASGFQTVEIVPTDFAGHTGYPQTKTCAGFRLDDLTPAKIDAMARKLADFAHVNLHALHGDLNIASHNPGIRRESQRQYLACIELAAQLPLKLVTFHPGTSKPGDRIGDDDFVRQCNVDFALMACDLLEKHDLVSAYENVGGMRFTALRDILDQVDSPRFGLLLDVGHCFIVDDADPHAIVADYHDRIVEIHMHGTYHRPDRGFENHQPLAADDCTAMPRFCRLVKQKGFSGPLVMEFIAPSARQYLDAARDGKRLIEQWWHEAP